MKPALSMEEPTAVSGLLQRYAFPPLRAGTILLGFSVPISVALDNVLLAVLLLGVLFNARAIWQIAAQNPAARASWLLFGVLSLAMFYGETPLREAVGILGKYVDLAFVPLFMLTLSAKVDRRRAQYAFLAAMGVTLLLSWLVGLGILPIQDWMDKAVAADNPVIFHSHITQNNMMAFAAFLALLNFREAASRVSRLIWGLLALLGVINVLFMVQGRTGYMIMMALLVWFGWVTLARSMRKRSMSWDWRHGVAVVLVFAGIAVGAYHASSRLQERVNLVASEYHDWQPNHGRETSTGQRLDFYYNTLQIVRQHPVLGVGTGGYAAAYARQTQGTEAIQTTNPHNEYLLVAVQTGMIGLGLLMFLFYTSWKCALLLDTPFEQDAARGLVLAYLVNSAINSPLHDHADGLLFAFMTAALFAGFKRGKRHG
ncbi:MAG: O-antigen ligase family protein [Gallionella sp.]|nr:O-antigen ligase family protein [Gallionella sp.]